MEAAKIFEILVKGPQASLINADGPEVKCEGRLNVTCVYNNNETLSAAIIKIGKEDVATLEFR